jgi:hypothetical protein
MREALACTISPSLDTYRILSEVKRMVGVEELGAFTQIGAFWVNHRSCCHVNMGQFTGKVSSVWSGAAEALVLEDQL